MAKVINDIIGVEGSICKGVYGYLYTYVVSCDFIQNH